MRGRRGPGSVGSSGSTRKYAPTGALALRARDGPVVRSPDLYPPRRSPALSARLTTLLAAVGAAPTWRPTDWEPPVYASDAEMDDAL